MPDDDPNSRLAQAVDWQNLALAALTMPGLGRPGSELPLLRSAVRNAPNLPVIALSRLEVLAAEAADAEVSPRVNGQSEAKPHGEIASWQADHQRTGASASRPPPHLANGYRGAALAADRVVEHKRKKTATTSADKVHIDVDAVLAAAQTLEKLGRSGSGAAIRMFAANLDGSFEVSKQGCEAAIREKQYSLAIRLLAHVEDNPHDGSNSEQIIALRRSLANLIRISPGGVQKVMARTRLASKLGIPSQVPVIGLVDPFSPFENINLLLRACTRLAQAGEKFRLLVVSDFPTPETPARSMSVAGLNTSWLIRVDNIPREQVADYYALMDVVISTRTQFLVPELVPPMRLIEAHAYGRPLVVSDTVSLAEYAQQHANMMIFKADRPDSLAQTLKLALKMRAREAGTTASCEPAPMDHLVKAMTWRSAVSKHKEPSEMAAKMPATPLLKPIAHDPHHKRHISTLTVACVLDEFTTECLSHEVGLLRLNRESWQSQLDATPPDFLLVESCWRGNDDNWGALSAGSGGGKKLGDLLRYCKLRGIPTVFWNKEDPPHYDKFGPIARMFDLALTTDTNMIPRYRKDFGVEVHPLSFGAQPQIHNPRAVIPRLDKAVFAGSYYGDKPERCQDFDAVMEQLHAAGLQYDIYDRNYGKGIKKFEFPERYQDSILGNLSPGQVWRAHKGYKYQINMNSVKTSPTMFARRVYESLASGTPVISNDSVGVRELFGDVVIMDGRQRIAEHLSALEASPKAYQALACRGVRAVMRGHTYGHRIQTLCRLLGIEIEIDQHEAVLAIIARQESDVYRAKKVFELQTAPCKRLFIELENFDSAYRFLNESNDAITYAMRIARGFYPDERQFYSSDRVLKYNLDTPLQPEALEDFVHWGIHLDANVEMAA